MATGMQNLGGAQFVITANANPFEASMKRAQADAKRTTQVIASQLGNMTVSTSTSLGVAGREVDKFNAKINAMGKGSSRTGLGLLALSSAVDDMQYGFRAIVNNIPQVVYMMGGSGGLAGTIGVAAVAVNVLINHWGQLMDAMQSSWLNVPAADLEKIRIRAEKAGEAFDKLMAAPGKVDNAQVDAIANAFAKAERGGAAGGMKGIAEAMGMDALHKVELTPAEQAMAGAKGRLTSPEVLAGVAKLQQAWDPAGFAKIMEKATADGVAKALREKKAEAVRQLIGQALMPGDQGDKAREAILALIKKFPQNFTDEFKRMMQAALSPEFFRQARIGQEAATKKELGSMLIPGGRTQHGVAGELMQGELGRQLMMGKFPEGAGAGGPATEAQALSALKQHPFFRRMNARAKRQLAGRMAGLTTDQISDVLGGITAGDVEKNAGRFAGNQFNAAVDLFDKRLDEAKKKGPGPPKPDAFQRAIKGQLHGAGIKINDEDAKGIARGMRDMLDERVTSLMLEHGMSRRQAQATALRENAMRGLPGFGRPAAMVGAAQYGSMILAGGFGQQAQLPDLARQQLRELVAIRTFLSQQAQRDAMGNAAGAIGGAAGAVFAGP